VGGAYQAPQQDDIASFLCFHNGSLYALHGFIKKTQKTPDDELAIARKRKHEVEDG